MMTHDTKSAQGLWRVISGQRLKAGMGPEWNSETQKNTNISSITKYFFIW